MVYGELPEEIKQQSLKGRLEYDKSRGEWKGKLPATHCLKIDGADIPVPTEDVTNPDDGWWEIIFVKNDHLLLKKRLWTWRGELHITYNVIYEEETSREYSRTMYRYSLGSLQPLLEPRIHVLHPLRIQVFEYTPLHQLSS